MAYVLTASKASSVRIACKAHFIHQQTESLISVSSNVLTVHQPGSLAAAQEIVCYGRISSLTSFKATGEALDHLLLTTEDHKYFSLSYRDGQIVTGVSGDLSTEGLKSPECGHKVIVNNDFLILYVYSGIVTLLPLRSGKQAKKRPADGNKVVGDPIQLRLNELKIHEIAMLGNGPQTVFGVLYRDQDLVSQFRTYEVVLKRGDYELKNGPFSMHKLEHGTNIILSDGADLVCCVGESTLYVKSSTINQTEYPLSVPTLFNSKTQLPSGDWILGDDYGLFYRITCAPKPVIKTLPNMNNSIPAVLVALQSELFIGSHYADSQLLKFPSFEVVDTKTNIGPISDILVEPPLGSGASSLITASGAYRNGSLRLIKYGVGVAATAELEIPGIRGIWGIDELAIIVISFVDSYIVLQVADDGEFAQIGAGDEAVIYACSLQRKLALVLKNQVKIDETSLPVSNISLAKHYKDKLYVLSDKLQVYSANLQLLNEMQFAEISAFDVAMDVIVIGFWDSKLWVGDLNFKQIRDEKVEGVPSSILLTKVNTESSLLIGMTDGTLLTYVYDTTLSSKKQSTLGTSPVTLHPFQTKQGTNVFAVSDRPTIIYATRSKLSFSGVNIPSCEYFTSFKNNALQSTLIIATNTGLTIGDTDDIQRLQFKTVPLGELARRLVLSNGYICALTMSLEVEETTGHELQRSHVRVYDHDTLELRAEWGLMDNEMCQSMCTYNDELVVGTSIQDDNEDECHRGRILIFGLKEDSLWLAKEVEVPGTVFCITSVQNKLVAGVNSFVRLFDVSDTITEISKHRSSTFAITIASRGNHVLVGDLMKSVTYLEVTETGLTEIARDYVPTWMTSVGFFQDKTFIGSEAAGNLILLEQSDSPLEENRLRLDRIGEYKIGEMVNKIVDGVIVQPEDTSIVKPHSLFVTVDGQIGILGAIQGAYTGLLLTLQTNLANVRPAVGGLSHAAYRAYSAHGLKATEPLRTVDGTLIEEFLDLTREEQETVVEGTDCSVEEVERIVEVLGRLR